MRPRADRNLLQEIAKNIRAQKHAMKTGKEVNNEIVTYFPFWCSIYGAGVVCLTMSLYIRSLFAL